MSKTAIALGCRSQRGLVCAALCLAPSACGSHAIDVGAVPDQTLPNPADAGGLGGGANLADVGSGSVNSTCSIPNLDQYRIVFDSDGGKLERRIYSMRADGSDLQALSPPEVYDAREPAISPDGTQLAYVGLQGIQLLDLSTGMPGALNIGMSGDHPRWSFDGSRLSLDQGGSVPSVLRMSDQVFEHSFCCGGPAEFMPPYDNWPNEIFMAFSENDDSIEQVDATGLALRHPALASSVPVTHPTASPDGNWIAASFECPNEVPSIWATPLIDETPACEGHRVTRSGGPSAINPEWGPGVLIAYERGEPPRDIAIVSADTGEECVIPGPGDDRNPSWVPATATQIPK